MRVGRGRAAHQGRAAVLLLVLLLTACTGSSRRSPPLPEAPDATATSADRLIFWINWRGVVDLSDKELDTWKARGVDGFVVVVQQLKSMGGNDYTGDPKADLSNPSYEVQRRLRDTGIVHRAKDRGLKMYLGFYLVNQTNNRTPLAEWFDDRGWTAQVLPDIAHVAGAAKLLGFAGLAVDQELYFDAASAQQPSWSVNYAGNTHTPEQTRAQVKERGAQVMQTILKAFPGVEITAYDTQIPNSWAALVQEEINHLPAAFDNVVHVDFWDGMTSVEGYSAIRFVDAIFYKTQHIRGSSWDVANQYNTNQVYSLLSRRWSNWAYASSRFFLSPFSWIDGGQSEFEAARPPDYVAEQLLAFRKWGTGREFDNFVIGDLRSFDYTPYEEGIRAASTPADVDTQPPVITSAVATRSGSSVDITGSATDNLAIRAVRWSTADDKDGGVARMTWKMSSGSTSSGWDWQMEWSIAGVPADAGEITLTVEDIKGLSSTSKVTAPA